jgi:trehalose/maltose hydrolase-like predicted phosphorylase
MWPNWLVFHPGIARDALSYRADRKGAARGNAAKNGFGGMMFPWESAFSGMEVDPAKGTTTEEHLQGDIAFAFHQYWDVTRDEDWLKAVGYDVFAGIAEFWASKAVRNSTDGSYSIPHIMGPDEYHGDVTDSVYCNVVAQFSIRYANTLAPLVPGKVANASQAMIADKLVIEYDEAKQYHPEYRGYARGTKVKQADTILLGYPLMYPMSDQVKANDLEYYASVMDPDGPAMTWSMLAIGYLDLQQYEKAATYFAKGYALNSLGPYRFWHEVRGGGGATNFITGAGGFVQSLWAGYGGLRIDANSTLKVVRPRPPPDCTGMKLRSFHFLGHRLHFDINLESWTVQLASSSARVGVSARSSSLQITGPDGNASKLTEVPLRYNTNVTAVISAAT